MIPTSTTQLPTYGNWIPAPDFRLQEGGFRLPTPDFQLPEAEFQLPTSGSWELGSRSSFWAIFSPILSSVLPSVASLLLPLFFCSLLLFPLSGPSLLFPPSSSLPSLSSFFVLLRTRRRTPQGCVAVWSPLQLAGPLLRLRLVPLYARLFALASRLSFARSAGRAGCRWLGLWLVECCLVRCCVGGRPVPGRLFRCRLCSRLGRSCRRWLGRCCTVACRWCFPL